MCYEYQLWRLKRIIYRALSDRARDRQSKLAAVGRWDARLEDVGLTEEALLQWYFQRLQRPLEANLPQYASGLGYEDVNDLVRAVLREFCYATVTEPAATDSSFLADVARSGTIVDGQE
jgi:hypothetical protein